MAYIRQNSFKSGVASFYIVVISTLVLVILATSFATAILAEIIRSSNDDLAQSAYDSAMAGVEEAKLAYTNYRNCINVNPSLIASSTSLDLSTDDVTCQDIVYWVTHPDGDPNNPNYNPCDMVALILGRVGSKQSANKEYEVGEVSLEQTTTGKTSDLDQAYTCVKLYTNPDNVFGTLNLSNPYKIIKFKTDVASAIDKITLSWHVNEGGIDYAYSNIINNNVAFAPINLISTPIPATITFQMIQTANTGFTFDQLNGTSIDNTTNHATMVFVPTKNKELAKSSNPVTNASSYIGIYDSESEIKTNRLSASQIASTSNHNKNYPYLVYCDESRLNEFACSVELELPKPIDSSKRSNEAFAFVVSLPYGSPQTDFVLEYICKIVEGNNSCSASNEYSADGSDTSIDTTQVVIDSTGRSGDLYRRVEVRLDTEISAAINGFPFFAIQADTIDKNVKTKNEWGIDDAPEPMPEPPEPEVITCTDESPYMQNWSGSDSLAVGQTIYMRDRRDNECYSVAKLESGQVWMTTNLNLGSSSPMRLTSADTNLNNGLSTYTLPASSDSWDLSHSDGDPITQKIYKSGNATGDCQTERCYTYYSYTAATAGADPLASGDATSDICPRGWKIPSRDEAVAVQIGPFAPGPRPSAFPSFISEHYATFFWLSTTFYYTSADLTHDYTCEEDDICDHAFLLAISSETFQAGMAGINKGRGKSVLCIKK